MRGWPRTFPQPHIKAGRQLLSHKRLPAFQGPAGGVSRGAVQPTWPPPGRACNHGGGACPLTTRGWEVLVAGHLGEPYGATQASHLPPPPPPAGSWHGSWACHSFLAFSLRPAHSRCCACLATSLPSPTLPLASDHHHPLARCLAALTSFLLRHLTCPNPILLHHAGDKRDKWRRQKAGRSLHLDLSVLI